MPFRFMLRSSCQCPRLVARTLINHASYLCPCLSCDKVDTRAQCPVSDTLSTPKGEIR